MLQDGGERTTFDGGAAREILLDKGRCDLLPLDILANRLHDPILGEISLFIREGNPDHLWEAIDLFCARDGMSFYKMMREVAIHYGEGALKYADRNWELGLPLHCFIDSGVRHYLKYLDNLYDEPHNRAFVWNMLGCIWTLRHHPHLNDLPFAEKKTAPIGVTLGPFKQSELTKPEYHIDCISDHGIMGIIQTNCVGISNDPDKGIYTD